MVGDVVECSFPYTDWSDEKERPVVVLSEVGMEDWIVCEITTNRQSREGDIAIDPDDFLSGSIPRRSVIRPIRLYALNTRLFGNTYGHLTDAKQAEVHSAVRSLFPL